MDGRIKTKSRRIYLLTGLAIPVVFLLCLFWGSVRIPSEAVFQVLTGQTVERPAWEYIVIHSRLPQAITALLAGAGLSVCGLMMQTLFHNPLADPSILGISSGANLGAALVLLSLGGGIGSFGSTSFGGQISVVMGALMGSFFILSLIIWFSAKIKNTIMLLIIGVMIGYLTSSAISILNFLSSAQGVQSFVLWGFGDFSGVSLKQIPFFSISMMIGLALAFSQIKMLDAFLLGESYAKNLGVHIVAHRVFILICTGLLTAIVTSFCGPIAFIGLAVPHVARLSVKTSNHRILMPLCLLMGALAALLCNLVCILPGTKGILPLNAITSLMGAPIILYVILNQKRIQYFQ